MNNEMNNEEPGRFSRHHHPKTEKDREQGRERAGKPGSRQREAGRRKYWREVLETVRK
jgi:hypothetical protein